MLDAPVSGGEPKAIDGTLAIMVGGDKTLFDECKEILGAMGKSVVRVGYGRSGGFTKLANQIIVAINIEAVGEALVLAQKAGLDPNSCLKRLRAAWREARFSMQKLQWL